MENLYDAVVEPDGRIPLKTSVQLENALKVLVAVPRPQADSVVSGLALSEPSLSGVWLHPEEDVAWEHLK